jgi:hypothetical protein
MRVEIDMADGCVFPRLCPCCLGAANLVELIKGSSPAGVYDVTASLEVPVCTACLAHRREGWKPALTIAGIGVALLPLAFLLRELVSARQGDIGYILSELLGMLFLLSLVLAVITFFWIRWRWPRSHSPHVRTGKALKVAPNPGVANWVLFDFANEEYGRLFKEMNSSRLTGIGVAGKAGA